MCLDFVNSRRFLLFILCASGCALPIFNLSPITSGKISNNGVMHVYLRENLKSLWLGITFSGWYNILGAIHTSELDRSEIDLSPKRSECERSNAN